jgi:chemotaxis signal transduction protein
VTDAVAPSHEVAAAPAELLRRAQAIDCGAVQVAVPFDWARNVVETFDLSPAPNAPVWLAGATNIEGRILPVLDLAAWLDPADAQAVDRHTRLLVGGDADEAYALLFRGLPMLARWTPTAATPAPTATATPADKLAPFVWGQATVAGPQPGAARPVIDARSLGQAWVAELTF